MDFPTYVPAPVRELISALVEGAHGWVAAIEDSEQELATIEDSIQVRTRRGEVDYLSSLRNQQLQTTQFRDLLRTNVDCLIRLAQDERMREAYALLSRESLDDEQWQNLVHSAFGANQDFRASRERLMRAQELRDQIVDTAEQLARLLNGIHGIGLSYVPSELYSVEKLLRKTDNRELQGYDLIAWRSMRGYVFGDLPLRNADEGQASGESMLRYAWQKEPPLWALMETVANAARDFQPAAYGTVGAAVASRQHNPKTEYLRALGTLLKETHRITLTPNVMRAMAIIANVAVDVDATYDDVRKALKMLGERLGSSGEE